MITTLERTDVLQAAANKWAAAFPRTAEYLDDLVAGGIRCGIFSSVLASMVAAEYGLPLARRPDDVDLLMANEDFSRAAALRARNVVRLESRKQLQTTTADGYPLRLVADNAVIDSQETNVQFMRPCVPLMCGDRLYDTRFGDWALGHTTILETPNARIPVTHPLHTQVMYGILQRAGSDKFDLLHASILSHITDPSDGYAALCTEKMHLDDRVWQYVATAGNVALATPPPK